MRPNIKSTSSGPCWGCGAKGERHFVYGLPKGGVGKALPYCPGPDRRVTIREVTEIHGSALYWSWLGGWNATGPLGQMGEGTGRTAVYRFYNASGVLLYVGITNDLKRRWKQHAEDKPWWDQVALKEHEWWPTRAEAEAQEARQIKRLRPVHNRAMNY